MKPESAENEPVRRIDALFSEAEEALSGLFELSETDLPPHSVKPQVSGEKGEENAICAVEIEFGRLTLSQSLRAKMTRGSIFSLGSPNGAGSDVRVRLYCDGSPRAEGVLMVEEGKIAVRVTRLAPFFDTVSDANSDADAVSAGSSDDDSGEDLSDVSADVSVEREKGGTPS